MSKLKTITQKLKLNKIKTGLVHVYTGKGKGKTTAALGLAMRAAGQGRKVKIIQFLKGKRDSGERKFINDMKIRRYDDMAKRKIGKIEIESFGRKELVDPENLMEEDFKEADKAMKKWEEEMKTGAWDMIILDEINVAVKFGLTSLSKIKKLIADKPKKLELVLTGRNVKTELIKLADYVTEFKEIKHPFKKGVKARNGIEY